MVMRRSARRPQAGGYDRSFPVAQDYDLWLRLSRGHAHGEPGRAARDPAPPAGARDRRRVTNDRLRAEARARWRAVRARHLSALVRGLRAAPVPGPGGAAARCAASCAVAGAADVGAPLRVLELLVSTDLGGGPAHVRDLVARALRRRVPVHGRRARRAAPHGGRSPRSAPSSSSVRADRLSLGVLRRRGPAHPGAPDPDRPLARQGRRALRPARRAADRAAAIHTFHGIHYRATRACT